MEPARKAPPSRLPARVAGSAEYRRGEYQTALSTQARPPFACRALIFPGQGVSSSRNSAGPGNRGVAWPVTQSRWPVRKNGDSGCPLCPPGICRMPSFSRPGETTIRSLAPLRRCCTRGMNESPGWACGGAANQRESHGTNWVKGWATTTVLWLPQV